MSENIKSELNFGIGGYDDRKHIGTPWIGYALIGVYCFLFVMIAQLASQDPYGIQPTKTFEYFTLYGKQPGFLYYIVNAVLSLFVQTNLFTLGLNIFSLWVFADKIEYAMGRFRFILFYFVAGILILWVNFIMDNTSVVPLSGAAACVAAILGAYLRIFPSDSIRMIPNAKLLSFIPAGIRQIKIRRFAVIWLILSFAFLWTGNGMLAAGTLAIFQIISLLVGYCIGSFFRNPHMALFGNIKTWKSYNKHFSYYDKEMIDPTLSVELQKQKMTE